MRRGEARRGLLWAPRSAGPWNGAGNGEAGFVKAVSLPQLGMQTVPPSVSCFPRACVFSFEEVSGAPMQRKGSTEDRPGSHLPLGETRTGNGAELRDLGDVVMLKVASYFWGRAQGRGLLCRSRWNAP